MSTDCTFLRAALSFLPLVDGSSSPTNPIDNGPFPADLNGSNFTYPWPVKLYKFQSQGQAVEMAFMDVPPRSSPGSNKNKLHKTAILLHGKNFCAATWRSTADKLSAAGYRVIMPDQIGFCKSSKPGHNYQYSLQQFALNTRGLLDALSIGGNVTVVGHSMGGMLTARYGLMYPSTIESAVMVNPLGLEDWKALGVPYQSIDASFATERASNYTSIRGYEQATYYVGTWDPAYDVWVNMLVNIYNGSRAVPFAAGQARVTDMVLTQPVVYEFGLLKPRTLLMIGDKDNTAIGKQWSPPDVQAKLGHYEVLGKRAASAIPNCTLIEFPDLGHAPQIQDPARFNAALLGWLKI
ncbi:alpha/beta hydrolase fold domain-containing protein [Bombardia bombarda]|uniref:Alpha/beta hydrolase fold domain-containing protein n=1 Tax=Bombardia bombarda TaxID=252184 RepID=A0AA40CAJ3_9PEZI|nr:alpha/beta hydrolase fold domain-containing protein [Bombardia bombarda]